MSTVEEIEAAITKLEFDAQWDLARRLHDRLWNAWDAEIEADAKLGHLDPLVAEVDRDIAAGRVKPLNEVLGNS